MPSVQRVHNDFHDKDVIMLAISIDGSAPKAVQTFLEKNGYTMPAVADTGMEMARRFGVRGIPMTYMINRQGMIVSSGFGPIDFDRPEFRAYLQALVAQPGG
jgi:peroxiredoxin